MNGIIYCRVSSKEQVDGTSLETQEEACRAYAGAHHITVVQVFREEGESAKVADRTELLNLLSFCQNRAHRVEVLVVWKLDRFARNVEDHYLVKAKLRGLGVGILSATEPIQSDANGKLLETILAGFAQFDNEIRAARTVQGMRQRLREGIHPWRPPIGYRPAPKSGTKKTEPDQPDPNTFPLLKEVWRRFAAGTDTQADLVRFLNREGLRTTDDCRVRQQFVDRLLTSPYYAGILIDPWSGEQFTGRHVTMVSPETFAAVQMKLQRARRRGRAPFANPHFLLRGLVRCAACGHYLTGSLSRGHTKRYPYYHCYNQACVRKQKSIAANKVEAEFTAFLAASSLVPKAVPNIATLMWQIVQEEDARLSDRRTGLATAMQSVDAELKALVGLMSRELITEREFVAQRDALRAKRLRLVADLEGLTHRQWSREELEHTLAAATTLESLSNGLKAEDHRQFQRMLMPGGYVFGSVGTADKSPLCLLNEAFLAGNSHIAVFVHDNWNSLIEGITGLSTLLKRAAPPLEAPNP